MWDTLVTKVTLEKWAPWVQKDQRALMERLEHQDRPEKRVRSVTLVRSEKWAHVEKMVTRVVMV